MPDQRGLTALADLATPMAIRVAATLGLVDLAGSAGATAPRLAADTGTAEPALRRLLDHLVAVGVFDRDGDTYRPTDLGDQMRADAPGPGRLVLDINSAGGRAELAFVELLSSVTTGEAAYPRRYGRGFWADLDAEPELRRTFDLQMNRRFRVMAAQIAERYDWGRFGHIVDVGGGDGTVLAEIMQRHPDVRGTVVELPPTAAAAAERFATAGLQHRAATVPGSFFDALPSGADAYVLSDILHDWDDPHAAAILARCAAAAGPHGRVVVIEPILGEGTDTQQDLFMLMCFAGRERDVDGLAALAAEHGLALLETVAVAEGRTLLEFRPTL